MKKSVSAAMAGGWMGLFVLLAVGCSGVDPEADAGTETDSGSTVDAGGDPDGGQGCVPLTCDTAGLLCGTADDGCGETLECGTCLCTAQSFQTDCPSRPCQVATGCVDNACTYEPVTCDFVQCDTCATGSCGETDLRQCGAGCADNYCDPSPSLVNGRTVYANACVARSSLRCGICELGSLECSGGASQPASCETLTVAGVNPEFVECDGSSPSATILYVDPADTGSVHDGGKNSPFLTLNDALAAAAQRSSRAIIIGGSPVFQQALQMTEGLSIYGGFTGVPAWLPDATRRPVLQVPASALQGGRLVGLSAVNIAAVTTELAGVDIVTPDLTGTNGAAGASNAGAHLVNSGKLVLRGVHFTVGAAQSGGTGANAGAPAGTVPAGGQGQASKEAVGSCGSLTPTQGGTATAPTCQTAVSASGLGGNGAGSPLPLNNADSGYTRGQDAPTGAQGGLASWSNNTFFFGPGQDGAPWTSAAPAGSTGTAGLAWSNAFPIPQGQGGAGTSGQAGRGGGGGSSGNRSISLISNQAVCRVGAGGGGGGAGGCGGLAGGGGYPGGWTFGVVLSSSAGVTFDGVSFTVGTPGAGGGGGNGSAGMAGANGGMGGPNSGSPTLIAYTGSPGGKGASGQTGGKGGGGANGEGVGIVCESTTSLELSKATFTSSGGTFQNTRGCN